MAPKGLSSMSFRERGLVCIIELDVPLHSLRMAQSPTTRSTTFRLRFAEPER